jgi:hypothetical protein
MIEGIREYLLSVIAASIICAIIINMIENKGIISAIIKILAGLFIIYTALSPWTKLRLDSLTTYFSDLKLEASMAVTDGKEYSSQATAAIIKNQVEAYILDKASSMDMEITVDVIVEGTSPPSPGYVKICGSVSPYKKQRLEQIIVDELGIPKENLTWT